MMIFLVCGSWYEIWWLSARMAVGAGRFDRLVHYFDNFAGNQKIKTKATWVIEPLLRAKLIRKPQIFRLIWGVRGADSVRTGHWLSRMESGDDGRDSLCSYPILPPFYPEAKLSWQYRSWWLVHVILCWWACPAIRKNRSWRVTCVSCGLRRAQR